MKETELSGYRKKILILTTEFPPGPGGIGNHAYNLSDFLNRSNIEVKVITASDFTDESAEKKFDAKQNYRVIRFKRYDSRIRTYRERLKIISEEVKSENFTHIIFSGRFSLYASLFLKKFKDKIKFLAIAHGGDINAGNISEKYFITKALKQMDLIIPVSEYSKTKLPSGISDSKIKVIHNGFNFEKMDTLILRNKPEIKDLLTLVSVGTVWPRKGHHNVLKAFEEILKVYPEVKYNIAGRLADLSKVKEYFDDKNLKDHLNIAGQVTNEELHNILRESDIFILLSESQSSGDFEGFGIAVLEANHFGLPAIGSRNSGLEDAIKNGVSGILVDPKNTKEICNAITEIKNNYPFYSEGARKWSASHHWSEIIKSYINEIEKLN